MFVHDSSWQLRSSVQSVESPRGLELRLCQLSSRCPGSGGGKVAVLQSVLKRVRTENVHIHKCLPTFILLLDSLVLKAKQRGGQCEMFTEMKCLHVVKKKEQL